jgi:hypothetical protein
VKPHRARSVPLSRKSDLRLGWIDSLELGRRAALQQPLGEGAVLSRSASRPNPEELRSSGGTLKEPSRARGGVIFSKHIPPESAIGLLGMLNWAYKWYKPGDRHGF